MKRRIFLKVLIIYPIIAGLMLSCSKDRLIDNEVNSILKNGIIAANGPLSPIESLGKMLFFDENLSPPGNLSCAVCHGPETGFTGPDSDINMKTGIYPGAVPTLSGSRKPPSSAYAGDSPVLHFDEDEKLWIGGMLWDGRATGWTLGDPLAEQAQKPFLGDLEHNLPDPRLVILRVKKSGYVGLFEEVWGPGSFNWTNDVEGTYERIARSIAAYERSAEVNPYSSKFDAYLAGDAVLSTQEAFGLELFEGKAMCSSCHISEEGTEGEPPLFTDFTFANIGIPKNPDNPFYFIPPKWNPDGQNWIDPGLGGFLKTAGYGPDIYEPEMGKHKVPTLRNVDLRPYEGLVKSFCHNGYFKSLEELVHFNNTRDVGDWPDPEVPETLNEDMLGDLSLTPEEEEAIVAFLKTLSDGYIQ